MCIGAGVVLALWAVIYRKIAAIPRTVCEVVRQERAAEAERAQTALQEAAALKVGALVQSLRNYDELSAHGYRSQIADAENRARRIERRASDAGVALSAASELVRESLALRDELRGLVATAATGGAPHQRETTELPHTAGLGPRPSLRPGAKATLLGIRPPLTAPPLRAPDAEDESRESSEEMTRVGERPPASALVMALASMAEGAPPSAGNGGAS